ncbi:SRPBCC domain-containing protein [Candidatus Acetothermia bacterium]|nr:SRPBCC domain-containing protein [Candidatus Acetothermia bacterium]MBI3643649.1 SRPBCC domain-containing protein [Candidatus Acetothermia bacterium]
MTQNNRTTQKTQRIEPFVISRVLDAPRDLMFKVWTDPKRLKNWWGPKGFTVTTLKVDLRPGGTMHYCLQGPNNLEIWGKFFYREVSPPERLVCVNCFSDKEGNITRHPLSPGWPREMLTTITFKDLKGKTEVCIEWLPINASAEEIQTFDSGRASMTGGWTGTFDQLAEYLAKIK